ncbi:leucine-rich repeat-containing protein 15 [Phlebotomus argentipes]|uniref:leucine-rich repeat-containing protein 15 n=1 Tax=Phlebotomus argentipes TaxID=94469 RepID=UPI002893203C|nr:leucine-rich repeat-containing protein 15 [Phlebotomus argentipes]
MLYFRLLLLPLFLHWAIAEDADKVADCVPGTAGCLQAPVMISAESVEPSGLKFVNKADNRKRKVERKSIVLEPDNLGQNWKCPNITRNRNLECGCDMPHTLRCSGDIHGLELIAQGLREAEYSVSLLDCTLKNVTFLSDARIFENVSLHGLVISSGEIKRVHRSAFLGLRTPLQALGLPNNALMSVPWNSLTPLMALDRLDLSNNRIKALGATDFASLQRLTYLELSDNQITSISQRTFSPLKRLVTLKVNGNRLGDFPSSIQAIGQCLNLRELDLKSNSIKGPLTKKLLPGLSQLEALNLDKNVLTSVHNGALEGFPRLITLSMRHNQIDVLQDHAFLGLNSLQVLDLGYNGIVAISGASLLHLKRLVVLDMTHNFLRALTSDLIAPLPALKELRLDGNDISIVAKNALEGTNELHSLSLLDNPLSCDCTLRPFAEWLGSSVSIPAHDLLGAVCATPPHLEGAPLLQVPVESLSCEASDGEFDNSNVLDQLETMSKNSSSSHIKDLSDVITLRELKLQPDYSLSLTWNILVSEYSCDAIFVYKETNIHEILLDHSPIHCERLGSDESVVSVNLADSSALIVGDSYRFCLVLLKEKGGQSELVVGCSNITRLMPTTPPPSDLSTFDRVSAAEELLVPEENATGDSEAKTLVENQTVAFFNNVHINKSFLPGLALGVLIMSVIVLIWGATKLKQSRHAPTVATCYTASGNGVAAGCQDAENHNNRYFKLQATTSL